MPRGAILRLVLIGAVVGAVATIFALIIAWLPEQASEEREGIDFVFWFTTVICIVVFAVVAAVLIYSVVKFRARPDDDSDGPPVHGHTGLEIVWTAIPAALVTAISIVSAVVVARNDSLPKDALKVRVIGQQFTWTFGYPDEKLATTTLRLPLGRSAVLEIGSQDVIHSFWVPEFGQKLDALPGTTNKLKVTPKKLGTYPVICTELCGLGHAVMRNQVVVMRPAAFERWIEEQKRAQDGPPGAAGKAVYNSLGCGSCHTFTPAGTKAELGPDLDKLPEQARRANRGSLEEFTEESIVTPNAYIEPGFPRGVMPPNYGEQLDEGQIEALVAFLVEGGKGGG